MHSSPNATGMVDSLEGRSYDTQQTQAEDAAPAYAEAPETQTHENTADLFAELHRMNLAAKRANDPHRGSISSSSDDNEEETGLVPLVEAEMAGSSREHENSSPVDEGEAVYSVEEVGSPVEDASPVDFSSPPAKLSGSVHSPGSPVASHVRSSVAESPQPEPEVVTQSPPHSAATKLASMHSRSLASAPLVSRSLASSSGSGSSHIIQETPHDMAQIISLWIKRGDLWRPAYSLAALNEHIRAKCPSDEHICTVHESQTRPFKLEIGARMFVDGHTDEYEILALIEDPSAFYYTGNNISKVELRATTGRSGPEVVDIECLYMREDVPRPMKRRRTAYIFSECLFAITKSGDHVPAVDKQTEEIAQMIQSHGGRVIEKLESLIEISDDISWAGDSSVFGAVIAPRQCQTPKYLQALAMGWPCLDCDFIYKSVSAGSLLDYSKYLLSPCYSRLCLSLEEQFYTRRILLGSVVPPVCLVASESSPLYALLVLACSKPVICLNAVEDAPEGSLVINDDGTGLEQLSPGVKEQLCRKAQLVETASMSRNWLIRCVGGGILI